MLLKHFIISACKYVYGSSLLVDILGSYVTVSTKVKREIVGIARRLGKEPVVLIDATDYG
jgi:hypothetical protein